MPHLADRSRLAGWLAIGVPAILIVITGVLRAGLQQEADAILARVARTDSVVQARSKILSRLGAAEAEARSYLLTADDGVLEPYQQWFQVRDSLFGVLRALTNGNPVQQHRVDTLDRLTSEQAAHLAETIAARRTSGPDAARRLFARDTGARYHTLREVIGRVEADELTARDAHFAAFRRAMTAQAWIATIGFLLALVSLGVLARVFMRMLERDRASVRTLDDRNRALAAQNDVLERQARQLAENADQLDRMVQSLRFSEQSLRREQQFLRAILDGMQEAVIAADADGRIQILNRAAAKLVPPNALEVPADRWAVANHLKQPDGSDLPADRVPLLRALRGETVVDEEIHTAWPDGSREVVVANARPVWSLSQELLGAVVVIRDETARRVAADALERTRHQLAQAQRLEAVGQLAGGIAHDFNNVLTGIVGMADLALMTDGLADELRDDLEAIRGAGMRASKVTRQLLMLSRKDVILRRPLCTSDVVRQVESLVRRTLAEDAIVELHLEATRQVLADATQLEHVILNLAANARDAMPGGGRLSIATRDARLDEPLQVDTGVLAAGSYVAIEVRDTGTGIPPEIIGRVFEPFFTTKGPMNGTGLGLATVYGIAQQLDGQVRIESAPGAGTAVTLFLPACEDGVPAPARRVPTRERQPGIETVLVAEDEPGVRLPVCRCLRGLGYTVLEATNGEDALRVLGAWQGPVHAVVTDVVMPGIGGARLVEHVRERYPRIRVLFISGYSDDQLDRKGALAAGTTYLAKPFGMDVLSRTLRQLLDDDLNALVSPRADGADRPVLVG